MKVVLLISVFFIVLTGGVLFFMSQNGQSEPKVLTPQITQPDQPTQTVDNPDALKVVAGDLEVPWAIAFLSDSRLLVTERPGRVKIIDANGIDDPIIAATIPVDQRHDGEGGLLGIALHPNYIQNHYVYLYYTYRSGESIWNRVVRMKLLNDKLTNEEIIVDKIPGALYHNGGRIKFGPDGFLYITTGDAQTDAAAQDTNSLAGKILRVTDLGKVPSDNPFDNPVYSYGHRNPQGISWDSRGELWETEHGRSNPTGFDEVNYIRSGLNYGWPAIQGDEIRVAMETPKINSGPTTTWAPSGAAFVGNSLFFGGLKGGALYEAVIQNNTVTELKTHYKGQFGRIREVIVGPDRMLYITTSNRDGRGSPQARDDKIIRIDPEKL